VWVFVTSQRVAMCDFCAEVVTFVGVLPVARGGVWPVGIKEGVKDCVGEYSLVVIQVVICNEFCVDVKLFNRVQEGSTQRPPDTTSAPASRHTIM